jgi:hypothetical protein
MKIGPLVFVAALLVAAGSQAQAPAPSPEMQAARDAFRKACAADTQKMCADKQGREMMMCLRTNSDKLSSECKDAMAKLPKPPAPSQYRALVYAMKAPPSGGAFFCARVRVQNALAR